MRTPAYALALAASLLLLGGTVAAQEQTTIPEFRVEEWIGEKSVTWEELQGSPYVLEFWATWCPPCRRSIPHLVELARIYEPLGIPIVALTNEPVEQKEQIEEFAREYRMNYHVGFDPQVGRALGVRGIPHAFVVDADGAATWSGNPLSPDFDKALQDTAAAWLFPEDQFPETAELAVAALSSQDKGAIEALNEMKAEHEEEATAALNKLDQLAAKIVESLDSLKQEAPAEYAIALSDLAEQFAGLPAAGEADKRVSAALEEPGVKDGVEVLRGLRRIKEGLEKDILAVLSEHTDRQEAVKHVVPLFEEAVKQLDQLAEAYPDAKHIEEVKQERGEMQGALDAFQQRQRGR